MTREFERAPLALRAWPSGADARGAPELAHSEPRPELRRLPPEELLRGAGGEESAERALATCHVQHL